MSLHKEHVPLFEIVVFMGLTASGKSYLAGKWSIRHCFPYFNTDIVRKELAGVVPTQQYGTGLNEGLYSSEYSLRTYEAMVSCARRAFKAGNEKCVVLDGSYRLRKYRDQLLREFVGRQICFVLCSCSERTVLGRLAERKNDPYSVSDGTLDVYRQQKITFEFPTEIPPDRLLKLDTDHSVEYLVECLDRKIMSHN